MHVMMGWVLLIAGTALYIAQIISSVNFKLAQRLGIQENAEAADPLLQRSERYTAHWDLVTLGWMPFAGWLIIIDHRWWSVAALIGGAIYLDASGREAVKILSFRHEGIRTGTNRQQIMFFSSYVIMAAMGIWLIANALNTLLW